MGFTKYNSNYKFFVVDIFFSIALQINKTNTVADNLIFKC